MRLTQSAFRSLSLVGAAGAGVLFAFALVWLFGALIWLEATFAQVLLSGNSAGVHLFYGFAVPLVDATVCGLLVGLTLGFVRVEARWLHAVIFFLAFYAVELATSGVQLFANLFVIAPFMWLFPLMTCLFILLSTSLKSRGSSRA